jgi:hypothetical protein
MFCYCFCTWAVKLIRRIFHLDNFIICWYRVIGMSSVFYGMFIAEGFDGVRRQAGQEIPGG